MKKKFVAGNWKMHHGPSAARGFVGAFHPEFDPTQVEVLLIPPAITLEALRAALPGDSPIALGVQQIHHEAAGAFTGEISAEMAIEAGASYALIGHSERRQLFHETEEGTRARVAAAYRAGLVPLLCVGETLAERREGKLEEVLIRQLDAVLADVEIREEIRTGETFILAYEPVWAIGTGETATPRDASEAHAILRARIAHHLGSFTGDATPILYGGSVNAGNASELMGSQGVDGVLVGGASLRPDSFTEIVLAAREIQARAS